MGIRDFGIKIFVFQKKNTFQKQGLKTQADATKLGDLKSKSSKHNMFLTTTPTRNFADRRGDQFENRVFMLCFMGKNEGRFLEGQ